MALVKIGPGKSLGALAVVGVLLALGVIACAPEVPQEMPSTYVEMEFSPPRVPQPTVLAINPTTGKIDFEQASGIRVPANCATAATASPPETAMEQATCEFYQYLESLDGFPTVLAGSAPVSAPLDLSTVTAPQNLFVYDETRGEKLTSLAVANDEVNETLTFFPAGGWEVGRNYVAAVRGFAIPLLPPAGVRAGGVMAASGEQVIGSQAYFLLKKEESLTCDGTDGEVNELCPFFELLMTPEGKDAPAPDPAEVKAQLTQLEQVRGLFDLLGLWDTVEGPGAMPREEAAIAWSFPTHSASVVELMPPLGMVPLVVGTNQLKLRAKGSIKASTLSPFALATPTGSVVLLDLTVLQAPENQGVFPPPPEALPPYTPTLDAENNIVLTTTDATIPLIDGHQYGIILLTRITSEAGQKIVPSPLVVMLKSAAQLVDAGGRSLIFGVDDASAQEAEAGRVQLKPLLDELLPLVSLGRADIAYMYAFTYPNP